MTRRLLAVGLFIVMGMTRLADSAWGYIVVPDYNNHASISVAASLLYQLKPHYYSADLKRFVTADPIGLEGGLNLFVYGSDNPLAFLDPLGLCGGPSWGQGSSQNSSYDGPVLRASLNAAEQQNLTDMSYGRAPITQADVAQAQVNRAILEAAVIAALTGGSPATGTAPKLLNQVNSVDSLLQKAGTFSKLKSGVQQGVINGNGDAIFSAITQGGQQLASGATKLSDGTFVMKYVSSTTGELTINVNKAGQIYKIRVPQ